MIFHFNQFNNFPYQQKHIGCNQRTVTSIRAVQFTHNKNCINLFFTISE